MRKFLDEKLIALSLKKEDLKEVAHKKLKGATAMEYVLIISIMAGVIIIGWRTFLGPAISNRMSQVSDEITNGF